MKITSLITTAALSGAMLTVLALQTAQAQTEPKIDEKCQVMLNYDVRVEPKKLVMSEKGKEMYRMEIDKLFIQGKQVSLNDKQKTLVNQYSDAVSTQVPEVIGLVNEAVSLASQAVSMALTPLLGDAAGSKLDEMMAGVQKRVDETASKQGDSYYLGATEASLQNTFDEEFEQEMENLVQSAIGALMINIGSQMLSGDGESFEAKMEAFSQKMDGIGEDIKQKMEVQSKGIEAKANALCDNFEKLMVLENQLRQEVPELSNFALTKNN
ncbi:YggN family protein [Shewanella acanthi]|uniref:YggN family protein n=1 Tax=Shewanella acanthi TaxID=2864212 RepID=UPI001C66188C|nr:YggN family protein [Shewanella acanthi]QYJ79792.1 YggN family protein [Shewanella acanthi]